jgi:hypothetical protein
LDNYNGYLIRLAGDCPCPLNRRVVELVQRMGANGCRRRWNGSRNSNRERRSPRPRFGGEGERGRTFKPPHPRPLSPEAGARGARGRKRPTLTCTPGKATLP